MMNRNGLSEGKHEERDMSFGDTEKSLKLRQRQAVKRRKLYEVRSEVGTEEPQINKQSELPVQSIEDKYEHMAQDLGNDLDSDVPEEKAVPERPMSPFHQGRIRKHSFIGGNYLEAVLETRHVQRKKMVHSHFRRVDEKQKEEGSISQNFGQEPRIREEPIHNHPDGKSINKDFGKKRTQCKSSQDNAEDSLSSVHDGPQKERKRKKLYEEQKKQGSRLRFGNDGCGVVRGIGAGISKKAMSAAVNSISAYPHKKVHEVEKDNSAVESAHRTEIIAEHSLRYALRSSQRMVQRKLSRWRESTACTEEGRKNRLQFEPPQEMEKSSGKKMGEGEKAEKKIRKRLWQKNRIKESYQAAKRGEKTTAEAVKATRTLVDKMENTALSVLKNSKRIWGVTVVLGLLFLMLSAGLSSCSVMAEGTFSSVVGTTYPSTDEDIHETENAYASLEEALNRQINNMESNHPGYDEYWYQIDEISHNPYHLISYFSAKYGGFTFNQVADEIEEIFREQYRLLVDEVKDTVTETKTVRVGESLGQVVTSGYCSCPVCCGAWSGGPTASGVYPTANHTIAVDASNPFVPMGTKVVMNGVEYVVEDTGAFAPYGVQFDVYYDDHAAASAHGHQAWEAYIADSNGSQEVEVTTTEVVNRLEVKLDNHNLDTVLRSRMDSNEEKRYDLYNATYGNRDYLFHVGSLPGGADGFGYEIPAGALSDEKFANMIHEAEKYLGFPYVWGGASPSTSFDCSGFVSWVIDHCGNGWNVGRRTAEGLRGCCAYVSPAKAKPGDLIFFQNTYPTSGASHVGIYVGNGMMIHCGEPIQYANIHSPYWQEHFMAFGRIQ